MANIKDVAKLANVSITTVSMVLNNRDNKISEKTREKVIKAANKLNYSPNPIARSLVMKRSNAILLVIPDISNPFFGVMAKELSVLFEKEGYWLYIYNSSVGNFDERVFLDLVEKNFIELSLIVDRRAKNFSSKTRDRHKIIFLDEINDEGMTVTCDNERGGYIVSEYLLDNTYKNIGLIAGEKDSMNSNQRIKGFLKNFKIRNIDFDKNNIFYGNYTFESGYENAKKLLQRKVDAVFCLNDMMAFGLIKYCKENNINVPNDLSVVGYDDVFISDLLSPRLTTINQDHQEIAREVIDLSKKILSKETIDKKKILIKPVLVKRDSVKERI
ncbi:MAG: LacI family DNA-binding transcriptional regulator [Anaerococcus sp.]|nr:LacI family DNA-binding transcriptional regulator [Anaerococcus sp.]